MHTATVVDKWLFNDEMIKNNERSVGGGGQKRRMTGQVGTSSVAAVFHVLGHGLCCRGRREEGSVPVLGPTSGGGPATVGVSQVGLSYGSGPESSPHVGHLLQEAPAFTECLNFSPLGTCIGQWVSSGVFGGPFPSLACHGLCLEWKSLA